MKKSIKVCAFAIADKNFLEYAKVSIYSMIFFNHNIDIKIIISDDSFDDYKKIFKNSNTHILKYQKDDYDINLEAKYNKIPSIWNNKSDLFFKRLKYFEILKNKYDIIIQMDLDTLCIKPLDTLLLNFWNSDKIIAGNSIQTCIKNKIKYPDDAIKPHYLTMGFTLFKTMYIPNDITNKCFNIIKNNYKELYLHDETIINEIYNNIDLKILYTEEISCFVNTFTENTYIYHFSGKAKPSTPDIYYPYKINTTLLKLYAIFAKEANVSKDFYKLIKLNIKLYNRVDKLYFYFKNIYETCKNNQSNEISI